MGVKAPVFFAVAMLMRDYESTETTYDKCTYALGATNIKSGVKRKNFTHHNVEKYFTSDLLSEVRKKRTP